jgi:hypothetical protein
MPAQDSILLLVFRTAAMVFVAIAWMPGMFGRRVRGRRLQRLGVGRLRAIRCRVRRLGRCGMRRFRLGTWRRWRRRCEMWLGRVHRLRLRL